MRLQSRYVVLMVFWLTWFWNMSSGQMIPVILPVIQQSLSVSIGIVSLVIASIAFGRSISSFSTSFLCKHFGRRNIIILGTVVASASLLLVSLSTHYIVILIMFFLTGIGFGIYLPPAISILSDFAHPKSKGKYIGFHESAASAGVSIGPIIAGLTLLSGLGWTGSLQIWLMPVIIILPSLVFLVNERTITKTSRTQVGENNDVHESPHYWSHSRLLLFQLAMIFRGSAISVRALLPLYWTKQLGVEVSVAAFTLGAVGFIAIFGQTLAGHLSDVFGRLKVLIILDLIMSTMLVMSVYLPFNPLLFVSLLVFSFSVSAFMPVVLVFISDMTVPVERTKLVGISMSFMYLFNGVHSGILGFLAEGFGFEMAWIYPIVLSFLSCIFLVVLRSIEVRP